MRLCKHGKSALLLKSNVAYCFLQHYHTVTPVPYLSSCARSCSPPAPTHFFDTIYFYKPLPRFAVFLAHPKSPDLHTETKGAFHYANDSGNFGRNSNGKVRFGFFRPEYSGSPLEVVHLFCLEYFRPKFAVPF